MPQPLPVELPETFNVSDEIADLRSAYSRVLLLEQAAHSSTDRESWEQKLVRAGGLGYLILEGPSMQASEVVAREVNACRSEDETDEIGEVYLHLPIIAVIMVNHSAVSDGSLVAT
jgi:hypothetical protein